MRNSYFVTIVAKQPHKSDMTKPIDGWVFSKQKLRFAFVYFLFIFKLSTILSLSLTLDVFSSVQAQKIERDKTKCAPKSWCLDNLKSLRTTESEEEKRYFLPRKWKYFFNNSKSNAKITHSVIKQTTLVVFVSRISNVSKYTNKIKIRFQCDRKQIGFQLFQ